METLSAPTNSSLCNWPGTDIQQTDILNKVHTIAEASLQKFTDFWRDGTELCIIWLIFATIPPKNHQIRAGRCIRDLAEHLRPILFWYHLFTTVTFSSGKLLQSSRKPHKMSAELHHLYKKSVILVTEEHYKQTRELWKFILAHDRCSSNLSWQSSPLKMCEVSDGPVQY